MKNHFNIKKLTIFTFIFMCFFAISNKVEAKTVTCNYNQAEGNKTDLTAIDGEIDLTLSYDDTADQSTKPKVNYKHMEGNQFVDLSVEFTIKNVLYNKCPDQLYMSRSSRYDKKIDGYHAKLYNTYNAANSESGYDYMHGFLLKNNTNYTNKESCTLYYNGDVHQKKVVIYYDKSGGTPEITYDGEFSTDGSKNVAQFKDLKSCPDKLYMTIKPGDGYGEVRNFYLNPPSGENYDYFGRESKVTVKKVDPDTSDTCLKINGAKKYIEMVYNLLKYAVPAIIIIFSTFEFVGVVLSGEDEKMEKAKKHFIIRLVVGALILIIPNLLDFILKMAGFIDKDLTDVVCNIIK